MKWRMLAGVMAIALLIVSTAIEAQQTGNVWRIGYLVPNTVESNRHLLAAFRKELRERGWVEGRDIVVEARYADGKIESLPALVADLIRQRIDLIVTVSSAATWAAKNATKSIPIVMAASADALGEGLVTSLAHPSGNITGMTFLAGPEIAGKQLQLLKEIVPAASRVAVLTNPTNRAHAAFVTEVKTAAQPLGLQLQVLEASSLGQLDNAFAVMKRQRMEALLVLTDSMFVGERRRVVDLAAESVLPALYSQREFVDAGGLVSYGPSLSDMFRRAAIYVDKLLRGAKPGDLPVEQPTKFELVINSKTTRTLRLTISPSLLQRADELVQ